MSSFVQMPKPAPYTDDDGNRFYNVRQAAQIVGDVCEATIWNWASKGVTPFGYELRVKRVAMTHHRRQKSDEAPPKNPRTDRMLIAEADVLALREILQGAGSHRPGGRSIAEMDILEAAAVQYQRRRVRKLAVRHP
jgi:hypothetical protein